MRLISVLIPYQIKSNRQICQSELNIRRYFSEEPFRVHDQKDEYGSSLTWGMRTRQMLGFCG